MCGAVKYEKERSGDWDVYSYYLLIINGSFGSFSLAALRVLILGSEVVWKRSLFVSVVDK